MYVMCVLICRNSHYLNFCIRFKKKSIFDDWIPSALDVIQVMGHFDITNKK